MPEATKSSPTTSLSSDNLSSQDPQLSEKYDDNLLTASDEEWGELWIEHDPETSSIDTKKEIFEQALYITWVRRGSQLSVFRKWRDSLKV